MIASCLSTCHNDERSLANGFAGRFSTSLPNLCQHLHAGSVNAFGLTMRAADKWDSPRFSGRFLASSEFCQTGVVSSRPLAANAGRWAALEMNNEIGNA